jgi:hypothetical protein
MTTSTAVNDDGLEWWQELIIKELNSGPCLGTNINCCLVCKMASFLEDQIARRQ